MFMSKLNPLLLLDYYKTTHSSQYPEGITKIVSYYTPRMTRIEGENKVTVFGIQAFIKAYLIDAFTENFFGVPKDVLMAEYRRVLDNSLGKGAVDYSKLEALYDLGYLPIEVKAVDEGLRTPVRVPQFSIENTHPKFAWLVNALETQISNSIWHAQISANVGYMYRRVVDKYYAATVEEDVPRSRALMEFSLRGQESTEAGILSSAGFLLSFLGTATVPSLSFFEKYYNANSDIEPVAFGGISTEHSVMNSNYAVDGDEVTFIKRLLMEIYPNTNFSMVSDSYDYWRLVREILPQCKKEILTHNGFIGIRGDSGDPVEIAVETVKALWEIFGGTINSKGYKVLDWHLKVIYGDSITIQRCEAIYRRLMEEGFACNNVLLGPGSLSFQCLLVDRPHVEETLAALENAKAAVSDPAVKAALEYTIGMTKRPEFAPFTRDTFGVAIKATYCEVGERKLPIFKDPKTDKSGSGENFKKSQRGLCVVFYDEDGEICYEDGFDSDTIKLYETRNLLKPVFYNGKFFREHTLAEVRGRLHDGKF